MRQLSLLIKLMVFQRDERLSAENLKGTEEEKEKIVEAV